VESHFLSSVGLPSSHSLFLVATVCASASGSLQSCPSSQSLSWTTHWSPGSSHSGRLPTGSSIHRRLKCETPPFCAHCFLWNSSFWKAADPEAIDSFLLALFSPLFLLAMAFQGPYWDHLLTLLQFFWTCCTFVVCKSPPWSRFCCCQAKSLFWIHTIERAPSAELSCLSVRH